jgi:ABC-type Na+ efflux pump permease subunit
MITLEHLNSLIIGTLAGIVAGIILLFSEGKNVKEIQKIAIKSLLFILLFMILFFLIVVEVNYLFSLLN